MKILAAMTTDGWRWGPGDPSLMGYVTTALYVVVAWLCWRRANQVSQDREHRFWIVLAFGLGLLAINKQGDLQSAFTYFGRGIAKSHEWYAERRVVQLYFVISVAIGSVVLLCGLLWSMRGLWRQCWLAVVGVTFQLGFIVIRAASSHHVDHFLGSRVGGAKVNWLLECGGLICIGVAAFRQETPVGNNAMRNLGKFTIAVLWLFIAASFAMAQGAQRIRNPYYRQSHWRLWTEDATPIRYQGAKRKARTGPAETNLAPTPPKTLAVTPPEDRLFPVFADSDKCTAFPVLKHLDRRPAIAGFWDDCYVNMDLGHSGFWPSWNASGLSIRLAGQFLNVRQGIPDARTRMALGANFTSQSIALRGRHIVDDSNSNLEAERDFFFANCVRATPAHTCYRDVDVLQVHDAYDGLFAHSFQSIGQSSSETLALTKMMIAGGCMPRSTKDLLKRHGAYAIALMTIFKAALPYTDAQGNELPYENELRHRPAYSSHGAIHHMHFCGANPGYHGYDEATHMQRMIDLARNLDTAPAVAILKLKDVTVKKDDQIIVDRRPADNRVQSVCKTSVRIWGKPGETIAARIDVRDSYDLQDKKLSFEWHTVYPNQQNVRIEPGGTRGVWRITATHDPNLPKGRIPVMLVARNGGSLPSNPAFVNFYWPQPNEKSDWPHYIDRQRGPKRVYDVTQNQRPRFEVQLAGNSVWIRPGETVRVPIQMSDPEGYPVTIYRRPGEVGEIHASELVYEVPANSLVGVYPVHLIFSDGTGGYASARFKIFVDPRPPDLPDGWRATVIGTPQQAGMVTFEDDTFRITGVSGQSRARTESGMFAYRAVPDDLDLLCQVQEIEVGGSLKIEPRLQLMIRDGFYDRAKNAVAITIGRTEAEFRTQSEWKSWKATPRDVERSDKNGWPRLRLIRRGEVCGGFVSTASGLWEQVGSIRTSMTGDAFAGLAFMGSSTVSADEPPSAIVEWMSPPSPSIPLIEFEGKRSRNGDAFIDNVKLTPIGTHHRGKIAYTVDGTDPDNDSPRFRRWHYLSTPGKYEVRARVIDGKQMGDLVVHRFQIADGG